MKHIFNKTILCMVAVLMSSAIWAQDIIVTSDAKRIEAKILEVSKSEIKYKENDNLDGPMFILGINEINSITYANGKVVLYNLTPDVGEKQTLPKSSRPTIDESTAEILMRSGNILTVQITDMKSNYVAYILDGKSYNMPASQIEKVTFLQNGQVKEYNGQSISNIEGMTLTDSKSSDVKDISKPSGRIYRDNGHYLHNDIYISSKEVERILQRENSAAYKQWKKAEGMLIGGSICTGIGAGLVLGGIYPLINRQYGISLGIECAAIVPLGIGLGLTLSASSQFNKAIDIYNSKYDQAAVQLKWSVALTGVGIALVF